MTSQLKQLLFFSTVGFIACIVVFWVPFSSKSQPDLQEPEVEENYDFTGELAEEQQPEFQLPPLSGTLKIQIGENLITTGILQLFSGFEKKHGITIQTSAFFSEPDLVLSENSSKTGLSLHLSQDISSYFLSGVRGIMREKNLIPLGIDPLVVYTHQDTHLDGDFSTRMEKRSPKSASSHFFFPPLVDEDQKSANTLGLLLYITELEHINDIGGFQSLIAEFGDYSSREKLLTAFSKQKGCEDLPLTCLMKKSFLGAGFAFSSDIHGKKELVSSIFPFPLGQSYAKLYSRHIPLESKNPERSRAFLLEYLQLNDQDLLMISHQLGMESPLLNLDTSSNQTLKDFILIDQALSSFSPQRLSLLKKVLEKKMKPDLYLENASVY